MVRGARENSGGRKKAAESWLSRGGGEGGCCCLSWNREQERATSKRARVSRVKAAPGSRKERIVLGGFYGVTTWCRVTTKSSQLPAVLVRSDPPRQSKTHCSHFKGFPKKSISSQQPDSERFPPTFSMSGNSNPRHSLL